MSKVLITTMMLVLATVYASRGLGDTPTTFSSGPERVTLVELFTSEGCSSCPPADRWLSGLKHQPGLWTEFIPVAFHVDYWDGLGWKDRYSRPEYSERQRRYAAEGGARVVYTPGMFQNGLEWLDWRDGVLADPRVERAGELEVTVNGEFVAVIFHAHQPGPREYTVHLALLGMDLETRVGAGENRGRKLVHDFVALATTSEPLVLGKSGWKALARLPGSGANHGETALAVWVARRGRQAPIQSTGGYLRHRR